MGNLPYRSECKCPCHATGGIHMTACCQPDPRMTPTNDAPVTVEQCDLDAAADWIGGDEGRWLRGDDPDWVSGSPDNTPLVQAFARHRIAALASAPAGDGVSKRPHFMAGSTSSDDPDGVMFRIVTLPPHGPGFWANRHNRNDALATLEAVYDAGVAAALARPRAAVGEQSREALEDAIGAAYAAWVNDESDASMSESIADAILALQSPPAKVEG